MFGEFEPSLTESVEKRRGRPVRVQTAELRRRRDLLYILLDRQWLEIRSLLKSVRAPEDIAKIFAVLTKDDALVPDAFTRKPTNRLLMSAHLRASNASNALVPFNRQLRKRISFLEREMLSISHQIDLRRDVLARVTVALAAPAPEAQKLRAAKYHARLQDELSGYEKNLNSLRTELGDMCTFVAWCDFLQFIRSRRYALRPLQTANALAGFPEMGFRQSSIRCRLFPAPKGTTVFDQYEALETIISSRPRKLRLVEYAETYLRSTAPSKGKAVRLFREKWYFLEQAIEQCVELRPRPRDIAAAILDKFRQLQSAASALDRLFEAEKRITRKRPKIEI